MKILILLILLSTAACTSAPTKSYSRLEAQKRQLQSAGFEVSYK